MTLDLKPAFFSPANFEFDNVAISVTDFDRSVQWYSRIFGFKPGYRTNIEALPAEFQILERPGLHVELLAQPGASRALDMIPGPHLKTSGVKALVFRTNDLEAATTFLEREQVTFVWKMKELSPDGLRATMIRDPDGTLINVLSYPDTRSREGRQAPGHE